jgi:hypothetical protein
MTNIYQKSKIVGGQFQDPSGQPLVSGILTWQLNHDSNVTILGGPTGIQIIAGNVINLYLDVNGNAAPNQYLWANSLLTPANSYYTVKAYTSAGILIWAVPQIFTLNYAPLIDLGTLTPLLP